MLMTLPKTALVLDRPNLRSLLLFVLSEAESGISGRVCASDTSEEARLRQEVAGDEDKRPWLLLAGGAGWPATLGLPIPPTPSLTSCSTSCV